MPGASSVGRPGASWRVVTPQYSQAAAFAASKPRTTRPPSEAELVGQRAGLGRGAGERGEDEGRGRGGRHGDCLLCCWSSTLCDLLVCVDAATLWLRICEFLPHAENRAIESVSCGLHFSSGQTPR